MTDLRRVHVVVDPRFGRRLLQLPADEPVWIVDTPENHPAILECWKRGPAPHQQGVTSFHYDSAGGPESCLIEEFATIHLHHASFSHDPPYAILEVYGVRWSDHIAAELLEFGMHLVEEQDGGFAAQKPSGASQRRFFR